MLSGGTLTNVSGVKSVIGIVQFVKENVSMSSNSDKVSNILMWEKLVRQIGAKLERQKLAIADSELQYAGAQAGLAEAKKQSELPLKGGGK